MTSTRQKISPPELARRWGVDASKILTWIRSGELRAINVATHCGGRPRYLIDLADILIFEQRRSAAPPPTAPRRRRKDPAIIQYF